MVIKISRLSGDLKLSVMTLLLLTLSAAQASAHCMGSSSDCAAHELKESALMQEIVTVQSTENERSGIVVMNANGGDAQVVIESAPGTAFRDVSWSGDGANILFRGEVNGRVGIYWIRAFKLDGPGNRYSFAPGEPRLVVATSSARDPRWSPVAAPDGRQWIAYGDIDAESGLRRIWVVDPNPPHRKFRLSTTNAGRHEDHPTWSPDARRIGIISEPDKKPCGCPGDIEILHLGVNAKTGALEATAKISLILNNPHLGNVADGFRDRLKGVAFRNADWANGSAWIATTANGRIWVFPSDPADVALKARGVGNNAGLPVWSPRDNALIYIRNGHGEACNISGINGQPTLQGGPAPPVRIGKITNCTTSAPLDWLGRWYEWWRGGVGVALPAMP